MKKDKVSAMNEWYTDIEGKISLISDIVTSALPVERIYLFGSYVNGDFSPERGSDLDFFVVLDDDYDKNPHEALVAIQFALWHDRRWGKDASYIPTDFLAQKSSRFDERAEVTTLDRKVSQEGRIIYDKR